ncbi:hypothetical protein FA95DRAFT_1580867 [Auriscalpium vulgare]|uniref:Uncharacterized protein n=1 Tax=Auriscalpium vulgare TaxID=40419 RepID=A0ACB8S4Z6_9AGAM|nr:hypothetical protein FA95DRAFT_1580867 [Auriscalpium vulgare]
MSSIDALVQEWLRIDKNPHTRREIQDLAATGQTLELEKRLRTRIEFGTAGLRGRMEAGWARMNDIIIIQASQGLCAYVSENVENAAQRGVVVGHDHRHHSAGWARLTAAAFIAKGFKVYLHRGLVHTPMVPFSIKKLNAACGVMITASHNPKEDNGYKVYWENAVQIISPHDKGISSSIKQNLEPQSWDTDNVVSSPLCIDATSQMSESYFAHIRTLSVTRELNREATPAFVNTSMHGVGHPFASRAFDEFGFAPFIPVAEQQGPDPDFPTVKFPNPEEKAYRTADREGLAYVLAQDPDADRFSAAEKNADGDWAQFTGDQLGAIFAARILEQYKASGKAIDKLAMVASTVSSKMIEAMAAAEGFTFSECLTGFKFIGNEALRLVNEGYEVPFGYEEAIGYMIGSEIRDKDGVSASVYFAELTLALSRQGKTPRGYLQELYERYGHFQTSNSYFVCHDPAIIDRIFAHIRNFDGVAVEGRPSYPQSIANLNVTSVRDLTIGYDTSNPPTYKPTLPLSSGHMIQFRAASEDDGVKIFLTIRCGNKSHVSQIKYYLEGSGKDAHIVDLLLKTVVSELGSAWMQAQQNGLASA